jgi:hypothetical protein
MKIEYTELRNAICGTQEELIRFRQLVVNSVLATDIMDKDLKQLRNTRWDKAFKMVDEGIADRDQDAEAVTNRKATTGEFVKVPSIQIIRSINFLSHVFFIHLLSLPCFSYRTHYPSFGCIAYHATLECLPQMERALFRRMLQSLLGGK